MFVKRINIDPAESRGKINEMLNDLNILESTYNQIRLHRKGKKI